MGKVRHIDWYADEWLSGTHELGNAERGLYITACCLIYSTGAPITRARLKAQCQDHGHAFNRQLGVLIDTGKLSEKDGQISNKRSINELQKAEERTANARQNGSKGGRPPKDNNSLAKPDGSVTEKLTTNHQPPTYQEESPVGDSLGEQAASGASNAGRRTRGTRLPLDWQPGPDERQFARDLGLDPSAVGDEFRDYWIAVTGAKGCKANWPSTFRNRCRQIAERRGSGQAGRPGGTGSSHSRIAAALSRVSFAADVSGPH
jgi:uncharacterized protein YdaU (DUF1376 family)